MSRTQVLFARVAQLFSVSWLLGLSWLCACWLLGALRADAQASPATSPTQLVGPHGLEGGRYVGSAIAPARSLRVAGSLGYAYTEGVLRDRDRHDRYALELAGAFVLMPSLQLSVASELRVDKHQGFRDGSDRGTLLATRFTTRHAFHVHPRVAIAVEPSLLFPGAQDVGRGFRAVSPSLAGLATFETGADTSLGLLVGYRLDGSERSVRDPYALSRADRLAAGISRSDSTLVGALFSYSAEPLNALVEWSWDISTQGRAKALQSPMRVRAALQYMAGERFLPGLEITVDHGGRPALSDALMRIEPRLSVRAHLVVLLDRVRPAPVTSATPRMTIVTPPLQIAELTSYQLHVQNDRSEPVAGARVQLAREGESVELTTNETGDVTLALARGVTAVSVQAEGYEPHWQTLSPGAENRATVSLSRGLPAGEIKGAIRNLSGDPLRARVELMGSDQFVDTGADGQFVIHVAPGHYTLRIAAPGYDPQERPVNVELRGVTILVVDLRRAHP